MFHVFGELTQKVLFGGYSERFATPPPSLETAFYSHVLILIGTLHKYYYY